ncbi:MAG TPA: tetratricopeptide repeat protein [Nocardioidaceae bacterium]|nr:tetratricopeptide repeat protein [Nocardioidaceae bacterium]
MAEQRRGSDRRQGAAKSRDGKPRGGRLRDGKPQGGKPRSSRPRDSGGQEKSAEQQRYDGPPLPDDITGRELDVSVRQQLRSLPDKLAARVARHLVAAGRLLDTDPETAYQHTLAARARATRLAIVREACGEAAYLAGHYAEALTELRAAKRMSGAPDYLPVMADCERALGRPERALSLSRDPGVEQLDTDSRIEMMIVAAGARLDMGQPEIAAQLLEGKDLRSRSHAPWAARLRYAYADALLAGGRDDDAVEWFHRAAAVDSEQLTDAAERLAELEGMQIVDVEEDEDDEGGR